MGYLYLYSIVLAYLAMPCVANRSWFLISGTARGSLTRRSRLQLDSPIAWFLESTKSFFMISDLRMDVILETDIHWYVAWGRFVLWSNGAIGSEHRYRKPYGLRSSFLKGNSRMTIRCTGAIRLKKHQENYTWLIQDWAYITVRSLESTQSPLEMSLGSLRWKVQPQHHGKSESNPSGSKNSSL